MALSIDTPIQFIKGVGPKLGDLFHRKGLLTVGDLLELYPRTYEDRRAARNIASLQENELVSLRATVRHVRSFQLGRSRRKIYEILVGDGSGTIACKFFRTPYRGYFERFQGQQLVRVVGRVLRYRGRLEFHHPEISEYKNDESEETGLFPIYAETEGLTSKKIGSIVSQALTQLLDRSQELPSSGRLRAPINGSSKVYSGARGRPSELEFGVIPDYLPSLIRVKYGLPDRATSLRYIHQPPKEAGDEYLKFRSPYQKRLIFEEFFWLELLLGLRRLGLKRSDAPAMRRDLSLVERLRHSLPFQLTEGQEKAFTDIVEDLVLPRPMGRLIQGDVGSGKTLVALMAALVAKQSGLQTAIMVPTEILAEQHYRNAQKFLQPLGVRVGLLLGSQKIKERESTMSQLQENHLDLCVGTHALIQEGVSFANLGLVIVDEQHRFGVDQRKKLIKKGLSPHFLVMTATPIPRTLAMTVYGDLDISVISHLPKGRQPIITRVTYESKREQVLLFLRQQVEKGRQAYVIYPLVEESEKIDLKDAVSEYEKLKSYFSGIEVGLLHGRMKAEEKDQVMAAFRENRIQILVSTTVVEVGVDVPNATTMLIVHAERFGLSQLHQLRGRVGRGEHKSYCILMLGYAVSDIARERAMIMERYSDGFKISEADLELRGPGEFLGTRQSGLPGFRMAHLLRDVEILKEARDAAFGLLKSDPQLQAEANRSIRVGWEKHNRSGENLIG